MVREDQGWIVRTIECRSVRTRSRFTATFRDTLAVAGVETLR